MRNYSFLFVGICWALVSFTCTSSAVTSQTDPAPSDAVVNQKPDKPVVVLHPQPAAESIAEYLPLLLGKKVAIVANPTSLVSGTHLIDTLLTYDIDITRVFGPEHGFRGKAGAGDLINDEVDPTTGLPIISLHGKNKKPSDQHMEGLDIVVFDIQDVGARFYTYLSTLHYVMEACAKNKVKLLVLDRPNPNGHYVDGPILQPGFESFIGMHPIPIVHGMTLGELATMINGEGWLPSAAKCDLQVIKCLSYNHATHYLLPVAPSPNLPTNRSIEIYPSLCLLEGTIVSVGRGTPWPFEIIGYPGNDQGSFVFTPISLPESAPYPKHQDIECVGIDLRKSGVVSGQIDLSILLSMYSTYSGEKDFFTTPTFFDKLAGSSDLREKIMDGKTEKEIRLSWQADLESFKAKRAQYLLYADF